jgi:CheY-like chemotaxis protein
MLIMHVDDDADDHEILYEAVREVNPKIRCIPAPNGIEAYQLLLHRNLFERVSCIFLDINMPLMDGLELLAKIKSDERLSHIPIFVYSTTGNEREINSVRKMGANFLQKSADYRSLTDTLKKIFASLPVKNLPEGKVRD